MLDCFVDFDSFDLKPKIIFLINDSKDNKDID